MSQETASILIPVNRLTVTEHLRIFGDPGNFPLEIYLEPEPVQAPQHFVFNLLLQGALFAIEGKLLETLGGVRDNQPLPEPPGDCLVMDAFNCFLKRDGFWFPACFGFKAASTAGSAPAVGSFAPEPETPLKWETLLRFLRTFYPFRQRFTLYRSLFPLENFFIYLKKLSHEFRAIPSNELEIMTNVRKNRYRVGDELVRRQVLSLRV